MIQGQSWSGQPPNDRAMCLPIAVASNAASKTRTSAAVTLNRSDCCNPNMSPVSLDPPMATVQPETLERLKLPTTGLPSRVPPSATPSDALRDAIATKVERLFCPRSALRPAVRATMVPAPSNIPATQPGGNFLAVQDLTEAVRQDADRQSLYAATPPENVGHLYSDRPALGSPLR